MSMLLTLLLNAAEIPIQNGAKPAIETITPFDPGPLLKNLNGQVAAEDAQTLFFPAEPFNQVKGIKDPGAYHKQLVSWFAKDLQREGERLKAGAPWVVESFKLGSCKWKEKGSEANALPYWSCYKSKLKLKNAKNESNLVEIRALINWGDRWWITHLGPIPKS